MHYFFEDIVIGWSHSFGSLKVERSEMLNYASQYDPRGIHLREEDAINSGARDVSASISFVTALSFKMMAQHIATIPGWTTCSLAVLEMDELRYHHPVCAGDILNSTWEIVEKIASNTTPGIGRVRSRHEVFNQNGDLVLSYWSTSGHRTRPVRG